MGSERKPAVLVTGASQGIGAGIAVAMARAGYDVAVTSTAVGKLAPVVAEIGAAGARALAVELDVRSQASIEQAMADAVAGFGEFDVLVNNAGINLQKSLLETSRADWDAVVATNLTGTVFMTQQMGRHLIAAGRPGCVINIGSAHGVVGFANRTAYGSTKAALHHLCKVLAVEWAPHNIRVNAVTPGWVVTPSRAARTVTPEAARLRLERIPLRRPCTIGEVAAAVLFLASPAGAYITGQTMILDGGVTVQ